MYASSEAHSSIQKAVELLGLGTDGLRKVPVRADFTVDVEAMRGMIAADRAAGLPADLHRRQRRHGEHRRRRRPARARGPCAAEGLWFHVDGAFGALACLSPGLRRLVAGMERADSLTFDFHKWLYLPYEIGVALVRTGRRTAAPSR